MYVPKGKIRLSSSNSVCWFGWITTCFPLLDDRDERPGAKLASMDLIGIDVSELAAPPTSLSLLNSTQRIDHLAANAGTIGYELLTSFGGRYKRLYREG